MGGDKETIVGMNGFKLLRIRLGVTNSCSQQWQIQQLQRNHRQRKKAAASHGRIGGVITCNHKMRREVCIDMYRHSFSPLVQ